MFEVVDGVFGSPGAETAWGTITITLSDCDTGHASFEGLDGVQEMDFVRLVGLRDIDCD
ncbi:MAG: hypothetical protein GWM87_15945 [Xanthomonadales bacterium]|nr:hypothetical protein [Xanthomonadales bacterium]NIQ94165.1 hypothetical protein [Desulfuromonadales bacterium]NIX14264.1 hypothetical protein [Xanthomonadales bacterium]